MATEMTESSTTAKRVGARWAAPRDPAILCLLSYGGPPGRIARAIFMILCWVSA